MMHSITAVIDNGAGPNLILQTNMPSTSTDRIRLVKGPVLTVVSRSNVIVDRVILLHIRIGDVRVKFWFGLVTILSIPLLLGTCFIDRLVKGIFPQEVKVIPFHSHPFAIVDILEKSAKAPALNDEENVDREREERCHLLRVAKGMHIEQI